MHMPSYLSQVFRVCLSGASGFRGVRISGFRAHGLEFGCSERALTF